MVSNLDNELAGPYFNDLSENNALCMIKNFISLA